jgi:hypothetical protein
MGRYASDNGGNFTPAPAGTHRAVCVELIDLGTQHSEYNGKPNVRQQVIIRWELSDEMMDDGKPYLVSEFYTNSLSEKSNLRPLLESWRGKEFTKEELAKFDLQNILGAPCLLSVIHKDGKARVSNASALPKTMERPKAINKTRAFWIDEWDQTVFESIPEGFRKIIMKSDEYGWREKAGSKVDSGSIEDLTDDIPF